MTATSIAAELGRLGAPGPPAPDDDARLALVDAIVSANAAGTLDHRAWLAAFDDAVHSLVARIVADGADELRRAATSSRYPGRRLRTVVPDAEAVDMLVNRMLAEAIGLEGLSDVAADSAGRRAHAGALEMAWEGVSRIARAEAARYRMLAAGMASWRRPVAAAWIVSSVVVVVALLIAGWLGGQLPAPEWFRPVGAFWWSLPWP